MESAWPFITQFGDSGLLLPLDIILIIALWAQESAEAAWQFARALLACMLALLLLKMLFLSYGYRWYGRLESPSGHAGLSVLVYGSMCAVLARHFSLRGWHLRLALAGALASSLIMGIAISRKLLGAHSVAEVLLGGVTGAACLALFVRGYARTPLRPMRLAATFGSFALAILLLLGSSFSPENHIHSAAGRIRHHLNSP